jgi:hypothetical protein
MFPWLIEDLIRVMLHFNVLTGGGLISASAAERINLV